MVSENTKNAYADVVKSIQSLSTEEKKDFVVRLQNHIKYEIFGIKYAESRLKHNAVLIEDGIEIKESPMPAYGGNAEYKNNYRVQMNLGCVVDENGIPMFGKSYDGNDSDIKIDEDIIELLGKILLLQIFENSLVKHVRHNSFCRHCIIQM